MLRQLYPGLQIQGDMVMKQILPLAATEHHQRHSQEDAPDFGIRTQHRNNFILLGESNYETTNDRTL
jgi:hypothetical protein